MDNKKTGSRGPGFGLTLERFYYKNVKSEC